MPKPNADQTPEGHNWLWTQEEEDERCYNDIPSKRGRAEIGAGA